ncbi:MAG: esterase [Planctomycetes bacterium]|nr:esterase [Planctomycetota bacterium]
MSAGWREIRVNGHPCDLFEPSRGNPHRHSVLYLHGVHGGKLADHPAFTESLERHGLPLVAPIAGPCWWTDRICRAFDERVTAERHLLDHVVPMIADRYGGTPRIGLLGTSMGGQGALRLAYKYPRLFPAVAALSPAIDYQIRWDTDPILRTMYADPESVRQDTALLWIHPLHWPAHQFFGCDPADTRWWDGADRLRMKLASLGIPFEADLETSAGGHGFAYYDRMAERAIGFLADRLPKGPA